MDCCEKPDIQDLTQGLGEQRHNYCRKCKAHEYKGDFYTQKEWDAWIGSPDDV